MAAQELQQFLATLRSGDRQAVNRVLEKFGPFFRKTIRLRLIDKRLRRVMETTDVFNSLLKDFLAQDHPPAETSAGLCAYLAAAVHHKILTRTRKERRHAGSLPHGWDAANAAETPAQEVDHRDFSEFIRGQLSEFDRRLLDLRQSGQTWPEITDEVGGNSDALRMRLRRAVAAVLGGAGHSELSRAR
jgi:DNA-directed RNA polymerase specialized sigma24 family protein